eukprot:3812009-Rhodomonas_salina.1
MHRQPGDEGRAQRGGGAACFCKARRHPCRRYHRHRLLFAIPFSSPEDAMQFASSQHHKSFICTMAELFLSRFPAAHARSALILLHSTWQESSRPAAAV